MIFTFPRHQAYYIRSSHSSTGSINTRFSEAGIDEKGLAPTSFPSERICARARCQTVQFVVSKLQFVH